MADEIKVIEESGFCSAEQELFSNEDPIEVVHWFGRYRPQPEGNGQFDGDTVRVELPDGRVLRGREIDFWIHDLGRPACKR